jgi:hypothetical protein
MGNSLLVGAKALMSKKFLGLGWSAERYKFN